MVWLYVLFYLLSVILIDQSLKYFDTFENDKSIILSACLTISIFSMLYFIGLNIHVLILSSIFLMFMLSLLYYLKKNHTKIKPATPINYKDFSLFNLIFIIGFWTYKKAITLDGRWDAWAFWNPHAKFLASKKWQELFNPMIDHVHSDYPLMLPATIAGFWKLWHTNSNLVPVFISLVVFYLILWSLFSFIKNRLLGISIVAYLVFNAVFYNEIFSQYADSLLALFYLVSIASFYYLKDKNDKLMFITGFLAFSSMWIKNEGIAFAIVFSVITYLFFFRKNRKKWRYFNYGSLLPAIHIIVFKTLFATRNDITGNLGKTISQAVDFQRLETIISFLFKTIYDFFPVIIVLVLLYLYKIGLKSQYKTGFAILTGIFGVYIFTYMVSPNNLNWHLATSAIRLIHQLLPLFLFLILNDLSTDKKQ